MRVVAIGILLVGLIVVALYSKLAPQPDASAANFAQPATQKRMPQATVPEGDMPEKGVQTSAVSSVKSSGQNASSDSFTDSLPDRIAIDVVLHTRDEIMELLNHTDRVVTAPRPDGSKPTIALVLHGPEVEFFAIKNYQQNRDIVDLAARLDAYRYVEIKMCETMMRKRGLKNEDIPGFIELVPYGPEELKQLQIKGFTVL